MSSQILLVVAVAVSVASVGVHGSVVRKETPKKCCLPSNYTAVLISLPTINSPAPTVFAAQVDYVRQQKVFLNYTNPIGSAGSGLTEDWDTKILYDYNKKKLYIVPGDKPDQCKVYPFPETMEKCIPDDADFLETAYFGSAGPKGLMYDAWRFLTHMTTAGMAGGSSQAGVVVTLAISRDCVPLIEGVHVIGSNPNLDQLYSVSNFTPKLVYPPAFRLPDSCFQ